MRSQNKLETFRLNFNRHFTAGRRNQQIFVNGNLKFLECTGCGFDDIESEYFAGLPKLQALHFSENRIVRIFENAFDANANLMLLNLSRNQIETLPVKLFGELKHFESLFMSENPIKLPTNAPFVESNSIKLIRLDNCNLSVIYEETFAQLVSLQTLNLSQNLISTLPDNSFVANVNLQSLFVEENRMRTFPISILEASTKLGELCVDRNPFSMRRREFERFREKFEKLSLRGDSCQNKNSSLFVENMDMALMGHFINGISNFFIGSYLTLVIICQAVAFVLLTFYYIKISKYERLEGGVNYANTILNDDEVYKVYRFNDDE